MAKIEVLAAGISGDAGLYQTYCEDEARSRKPTATPSLERAIKRRRKLEKPAEIARTSLETDTPGSNSSSPSATAPIKEQLTAPKTMTPTDAARKATVQADGNIGQGDRLPLLSGGASVPIIASVIDEIYAEQPLGACGAPSAISALLLVNWNVRKSTITALRHKFPPKAMITPIGVEMAATVMEQRLTTMLWMCGGFGDVVAVVNFGNDITREAIRLRIDALDHPAAPNAAAFHVVSDLDVTFSCAGPEPTDPQYELETFQVKHYPKPVEVFVPEIEYDRNAQTMIPVMKKGKLVGRTESRYSKPCVIPYRKPVFAEASVTHIKSTFQHFKDFVEPEPAFGTVKMSFPGLEAYVVQQQLGKLEISRKTSYPSRDAELLYDSMIEWLPSEPKASEVFLSVGGWISSDATKYLQKITLCSKRTIQDLQDGPVVEANAASAETQTPVESRTLVIFEMDTGLRKFEKQQEYATQVQEDSDDELDPETLREIRAHVKSQVEQNKANWEEEQAKKEMEELQPSIESSDEDAELEEGEILE